MPSGAAEIALATDFAIIVVAAAFVGFAAVRTGQPTIIAYILTGLLLGPAALGVIEPGILTETMAELGLAFLLFLLGIKMRLDEIRHVLTPIVKISIPQMGLVALVGFVASIVLGFGRWEAVLIGLAVMYSSTAVIIKMLTDKDEATTLHGKIDVGILLVQDVVVVILLALLAAGVPDSASEVAFTLGTILVLIVVIGVVAVFASRYVLPSIFRRIANDTEAFFLVAVSWAFLFILISAELNLSIEMGAFLAGLAIAQLPYSKELQARINPITDLFVLVFFVTVSLELEAADLFLFWQEAVLAALILMPAKFVIFFALINWQQFDIGTTFLGSVNMIQVSEFGLIVGAVAVTQGFIDESVLGFLTLVALFTMGVSVYVIQYNSRLFKWAEPFVERWEAENATTPATDTYQNHVVVIGFDEIARRSLEVLETHYDQIVVIDRKTDHTEPIETAGYDVLFGDFRYAKIRKEAALKKADFVFSSSVQREINDILLNEVKEETTVFVEADTVTDAQELYEQGVDYVILSPHLAIEQLNEYLESYLDSPEAFDRAVESDMTFLRSGRLFPERSSHEGGDDD